MAEIAMDSRFRNDRITGTQRYALEVTSRLRIPVREIAPSYPLKGARGLWWQQTRLPHLCGSDLLWSPIAGGPLVYRRQVATVHDLSPVEHPEWFSKKVGLWYQWLLPRLIRRVQHVITDAEYTRQRVIALGKVSPEKVTAISLGVDSRFTKRAEEECRGAKARFGIESRHYLLSLCTLEPRKNIGLLLNVWGDLQPSLPPGWTLVLAGGTAPATVFASASIPQGVPGVLFTGYVDESILPALISGASAFVNPSLYEGFGLPVLEAMACGVPVIAGNATSLPEVVGEAGLLVSPTDPAAIGRAILAITAAEELRNCLGKAGIERSKYFTWDRCAAATESLLIREASSVGR